MTKTRFAARLAKLSFSSSLATIRRNRALRDRGIEIHDFGSKADTPEHIKRAAIEYLQSKTASLYADPRGIPELRAAIARKLKDENGVTADPETEITVCAGGKQGILAALLALVDRGDEVLLEDPGWLSFEPMVRIAGANPVPIPLIEKDGFRFRIEDLEKRITRKTRLILLCNPHNPTGRVFTRADLDAIARVAVERNLLVLMDEAYEKFIYDDHAHVSIATLRSMRERTITVQTASKIYNMFGWRVGWVVAPAEISARIQMVSSHSITCVTSFAQAGAAAALAQPIAQGGITMEALNRNYQLQRDALMAGLREIPGITCQVPAGAYFAFPRIKSFGLASQAMTDALFEKVHVSCIPGSVFGKRGEGHLRFVFNAPVAEIEAGVARLKQFFRTL
ncbi:MAG: aminotransferase class I/II-fold pyridoxal phosphate-dependent enzyme [Gemmatimonadaceae bacterium]